MKVRIRFSKTGALVYIGHLDVMRYFQKLFRRAHLPVRYSEGFSPHQILSFTPPLPLGMESEGEYADVELTEPVTTQEALRSLRAQSVPEIKIMSFRQLPEKCENAMASVRAAAYSVSFDDNGSFDLDRAVSYVLSKDSLVTLKKTKKSEKEIDIRPLVYDLRVNGRNIDMLISSGSTDNIKPELVLRAMSDDQDSFPDITKISIKRIDQYTKAENFISLDAIGTDI